MMYIGLIVGIFVASAAIIAGVVGLVLAKKNQEKKKWPMWAIIAGIVALVSAVINSGLSGNGLF